MDNKHLVRLARLRSAAARAGQPFDLMRFVEQRPYAQGVLGELMTAEDEALVVLALEVLNDLNVAEHAAATAPAARPDPMASPPPAPASDAASARRAALESRYVGRLR